jgi:ectoine hydroxylase-related dioxygenase (phytanoyl-CoA dioxygenase family)
MASTMSEHYGFVEETEIEKFWNNGFVVLRNVIEPTHVLSMEDAISRVLDKDGVDLSELGSLIAPENTLTDEDDSASEKVGRFIAGTDHWVGDSDFENFACNSIIPEVVAQVLRSESLWLYEDSVLVKEPNTSEETTFHKDLSYFHVNGEQVCTVWVPLDFASPDTGAIRFVKGSHEDKTSYRPNWFVSDEPLPNTEGKRVPAVASEDVVAPTLSVGDISIHHARTLHGASANRSVNQSRRAISIRYCGDDARYHLRQGAPLKPHHETITEGDILTHEYCPKVWPKN